MLQNLEVFTPGVTSPPLPIVDQKEFFDSIQIINIDGLGPVKATVNLTQYGSLDGGFLNGVYTPNRNIVLTLRLNPDWASQSVESLRMMLYSYFMPQSVVRLRFTSTHLPVVEIDGIVESCDPNLWDKDSNNYQVSIINPNPYFVALDETAVTGKTASFSDTEANVVTYQGSVDTGFILDIDFPSDGMPDASSSFVGDIRLIAPKSQQASIVTGVSVNPSQSVEISSVQGDKFVRQMSLTGQAPQSLLAQWANGSSWLTLTQGDNLFRFLSASPGLAWQLRYFAKYGGL